MIEKVRFKDIYKHQRGWGYELWIENLPEYCGKILFIDAHRKTSLHYHVKKMETMFLYKGHVRIYLANEQPDVLSEEALKTDKFYTVDLNPGDKILIPRMQIHRIEAFKDSELFEFSTEHFEDDSIRLLKGD